MQVAEEVARIGRSSRTKNQTRKKEKRNIARMKHGRKIENKMGVYLGFEKPG
jgi:hypothetical protein